MILQNYDKRIKRRARKINGIKKGISNIDNRMERRKDRKKHRSENGLQFNYVFQDEAQKVRDKSVKDKLSYEDWYNENEERINTELAESGADREYCFNPENEFEKRYNKYLEKWPI